VKRWTERFVAHSTFGDSCKGRTPHKCRNALSRGITAQNPNVIPRGPSYPEGNFEGNQLLGGSMSLSPLYRVQTNDLHVSTARPTSIAVSSDFVVTRHRSPPFGSHRTRYHSTEVLRTSPSVSVEGEEAKGLPFRLPARTENNTLSISLRDDGHECVFCPITRVHSGLLGPCFKTEGTTSPFQRRFVIRSWSSTPKHSLHEPFDSLRRPIVH